MEKSLTVFVCSLYSGWSVFASMEISLKDLAPKPGFQVNSCFLEQIS